MENFLVTVILPCRNEELAIGKCLNELREVSRKNRLKLQIIVSDSSFDSSPKIAKEYNAQLIKHDKEGYGRAYLEAIPFAKGKYIIMADADGTYDFNNLPIFIKELEKGADLVIGNRFSGNIEKKAMPFLHKYIGTPILSFIARSLYGIKVKDTQCGMRAITKDALTKLNLKTTGMEFASEMIIKASIKKLKITQLPINYRTRIGDSKLRTWQDGWRHLKIMLLYNPNYLFLYPGALLFVSGLFFLISIYFGALSIFGHKLMEHPMFLASSAIIVGYQLMIFAMFAKSFGLTQFNEESRMVTRISAVMNLEKWIFLGSLFIIAGLIVYLNILNSWITYNFGELSQIKQAIVALTLIILGVQTIFSSFMLSLLSIKRA